MFILIVRPHAAQKATEAAHWIQAKRWRSEKLKFFFLPGSSPELNPDEMLNQDTK